MSRQTKTPKQRAEDALGVAQRRYDRAEANAIRLKKEYHAASTELDDANDLLMYAKSHPALQSTNPTTQEGTTE